MTRGRIRERPWRQVAATYAALAFFFAALAGCSIRHSGRQEAPAPAKPIDSLVVDKRNGFFGSFAAETALLEREARDGRGAVVRPARYGTRRVFRPKTFLCGWAAEAEAGGAYEALYDHAVEAISHCNVEFEVASDALIARQVNPSFPDDRSRWEIALKIPIESHFDYEPKKDAGGRDTGESAEVSGGPNFEDRAFMRLKLSEMEIVKLGYALSGMKKALLVEDVEWDGANGFLGFSATVNSPVADCRSPGCDGGNAQAKFRVNFKAFESNPSFQKTPFHDSNYRYMNVLHVMGKKVDGSAQALYAAHWDLSKDLKVYLYGFPERFRPLAADVVSEWNAALRAAGALAPGQPGFAIAGEEPRHPFDLRYPTIVWVDDMRIAYRSPLGVGMAHADVRNGEILWGSITLYGGLVESYIKSYMPIDVAPTGADAIGAHAFLDQLFGAHPGASGLRPPPGIAAAARLDPRLAASPGRMPGLASEGAMRDATLAARGDAGRAARQVLEQNGELAPELAQAMAQEMAAVAAARLPDALAGSGQRLRDSLQAPFAAAADAIEGDGTSPGLADGAAESARRLEQARAALAFHSNIFDADRTLGDVAAGWSAAAQEAKRDYRSAVRVVVKELLSHEYGHFLGLGHQFKENILPEDGTVPPKYLSGSGWLDTATGQPRPGLKELATESAGWINATSIMGYRDPRTQISNSESLVKPGPQDELVLRYIYTRRYSVYKAGDAEFSSVPVGPDGVIPSAPPELEGYFTAYFPQCNDIQASLAMDPFCNRFDRGSTAVDITKNYVASLNDNLAQVLVAFSDGRGGNPWGAYARLWLRSFSTMSRLRLFYDYMRREPAFRAAIDEIRGEEEMLYDFSRACETDAADVPARLRQIMAGNPSLKDLCAANAYAMREYKSLLSLNATDFTQMSPGNGYVPGGIRGGDSEADYSRVDGSWTELGALPLKYAAIFAMESSQPWAQLGFSMAPVPGYDNPATLARYSWLYPRELTEALSSAVSANLKFVGIDPTDRTSMGQAVPALGLLNQVGQLRPSDAGLFPSRFVERVRSQARFDVSVVAIVLRGEKKDGATSELRVDKFSGDVFDFQEGEKIPLSSAFLLPDGQVIAQAPEMFLYPVTRFKLLSDRAGYVLAYKLSYFRDPDDRFAEISVKSQLKAKHDSVLNACVMGPHGSLNGLSQFFNRTEKGFDGFYMPDGLYDDPEEKGKAFLRSVQQAFDRYYESPKFSANPPKRASCDEAIRGLGLIISSAAAMNGYWLPEASGYLQY